METWKENIADILASLLGLSFIDLEKMISKKEIEVAVFADLFETEISQIYKEKRDDAKGTLEQLELFESFYKNILFDFIEFTQRGNDSGNGNKDELIDKFNDLNGLTKSIRDSGQKSFFRYFTSLTRDFEPAIQIIQSLSAISDSIVLCSFIPLNLLEGTKVEDKKQFLKRIAEEFINGYALDGEVLVQVTFSRFLNAIDFRFIVSESGKRKLSVLFKFLADYTSAIYSSRKDPKKPKAVILQLDDYRYLNQQDSRRITNINRLLDESEENSISDIIRLMDKRDKNDR